MKTGEYLSDEIPSLSQALLLLPTRCHVLPSKALSPELSLLHSKKALRVDFAQTMLSQRFREFTVNLACNSQASHTFLPSKLTTEADKYNTEKKRVDPLWQISEN